MHIFSFEKLDAWIKSKDLVIKIYSLSESFPLIEQFGITNQLRRAIVSVASNIAEGTSRKTAKEQARFTQIAYSSLMEVLNQIIICKELNFIGNEEYICYEIRLRF